jgi:hypothetical protein
MKGSSKIGGTCHVCDAIGRRYAEGRCHMPIAKCVTVAIPVSERQAAGTQKLSTGVCVRWLHVSGRGIRRGGLCEQCGRSGLFSRLSPSVGVTRDSGAVKEAGKQAESRSGDITMRTQAVAVLAVLSVLLAADASFGYYNQSLGRWTSEDPVGMDPATRVSMTRFSPRKQLASTTGLFEYAHSRVINSGDPLGLFEPDPIYGQWGSAEVDPVYIGAGDMPTGDSDTFTPTVVPVSGPTAGDCGAAKYEIRWGIPSSGINGYIVQQVTMSIEITDCSGKPIISQSDLYWESWDVTNGSAHNTYGSDIFEWGGGNNSGKCSLECTKGAKKWRGFAKGFKSKRSVPDGFVAQSVPQARDLPATRNRPANWWNGVESVPHFMTVRWDYCNGNKTTQATIH